MTPDKVALEAQLKTLSEDWASLGAAISQRQQEIQQATARIAVLNEEIQRNQGAMAYSQVLSERIKKQLNELEKPSSPSA